MNEIWKDIEGFEGYYQVSNLGRVKSLDRWVRNSEKSKRFVPSQIMADVSDKDGYRELILHKNGKKKTYKVHRIVAQTFIPNPDNLPEVNHRDDNKSNNEVDNLEWCDRTYNNTYNGKAKRTGLTQGKRINQYTLDGEFIRTWNTIHEPEHEIGFSSANISSACRGKAKTAYGYIWKYA